MSKKEIFNSDNFQAACVLIEDIRRGGNIQDIVDSIKAVDDTARWCGCRDELFAALTNITIYKQYRGVGLDRILMGGRGVPFSRDVKPAYGDILELPVWVEVALERNEYGYPIEGGETEVSRMRLRDAIEY